MNRIRYVITYLINIYNKQTQCAHVLHFGIIKFFGVFVVH